MQKQWDEKATAANEIDKKLNRNIPLKIRVLMHLKQSSICTPWIKKVMYTYKDKRSINERENILSVYIYIFIYIRIYFFKCVYKIKNSKKKMKK